MKNAEIQELLSTEKKQKYSKTTGHLWFSGMSRNSLPNTGGWW